MIIVETCCCGCSLESGSLIIMIYFVLNGWQAMLLSMLIDMDVTATTVRFSIGVVSSVIPVFGFLAVYSRKPTLLMPVIVEAFILSALSIFKLISILAFGVNNVIVPSYVSYEPGPMTHEVSQLIDSKFAFEENHRRKLTQELYAISMVSFTIIDSVSFPYFCIVLLSYYYEMKEDILLYPDGRRPTIFKESSRNRSGYPLLQTPYPPQWQSLETRSVNEVALVPVSGSVSI